MLEFHKLFKNISTLTALAGLYIPGLQHISGTKENILKTFSLLTAASQFVNLILLIYLLAYNWKSVRDPALSGVGIFLFVYSVFITIFFYAVSQKLDQFLKKIDTSFFMVYNSPLCNKETLSILLENLVNKANKYSVYYVGLLSSMSLTNALTRLLSYWFNLSEENLLPYQFPFEPKGFPLLDITLIYQLISGLLCTTKKCATDSFFAVLFLYVHFCYKELGNIFKDNFYKDEVTDDRMDTLKLWIQLHQQYQR